MHDAARVRVSERVKHVDEQLDDVGDRELVLAVQPLSKRLSVDERHYIVEQPAGFARIQQRKDVGVLQLRRYFDLAEETCASD